MNKRRQMGAYPDDGAEDNAQTEELASDINDQLLEEAIWLERHAKSMGWHDVEAI